MMKYNLIWLIVSVCGLSLSAYAADETNNKIDVKREIDQLKTKIQQLEIHLASTEKTTNSVNPHKTDTNSSKAANQTGKNNPTTKAKQNSGASAINQNNRNNTSQGKASGEDKSSEAISSTITTDANCIPHLSWQGPDIAFLIAGGASAGLSIPSGQSGSFNILDFEPIFLASYKDIIFLRSAIDFSLDDFGNTDVELSYINLNLFVNDYAVFGAGKFDSALGYFVQNLSPVWINRMPDAPVGFDGDQAAPQGEVGIRLQGAFPLFCDMKINYSLFMSNGDHAFVDTDNIVIDHIGSDGYVNNFGNYMYGGRLGFLPIPKLEIGISAATGKLALLDLTDGTTLLQRSRVYSAIGADFSYKPGNWDLRAEYIQQLISSQSGSIVPQGQKWKAWYGQIAYWIPNTKWEPVVRYSKFTCPVADQEQRQWAFGVDYWFAPSIAAQAAFEFNKGQEGADTDVNQFLIQLVFGF